MKTVTAHKIEDFLIGLSIFVSSIVFFKTPFEGYFHYLIFILYLPFFITKYGLPFTTFKLLAIPTLVSLIYVIIGENPFFNFFKIFMGMLLSFSFYQYVLIHYEYNVVKLFRIYVKGGLIVCYVGIIQAISYLIQFRPGYSYHWIFNKWGNNPGGLLGIRINSIFSEASQFAIVISPLVFLVLYNIISRKYFIISRFNCIIVLVCLIMSTSSTGYLGFLLSGLILAINYKKILDLVVILSLICVGVYFLYSNIGEFQSRVTAYSNIVSKENLSISDINSSSFVQYNNFQVAKSSFAKNPIFGTGLGSYPKAYEKYSLTKQEDFIIKKGFDFNSQDGNSIFLRILVEVGLVGIIFLFVIVIRCFVIKDNNYGDKVSWIISSSFLVIILLYYIRQGNYFLNAFPFFVWMYYYNWVNNNSYKRLIFSEHE